MSELNQQGRQKTRGRSLTMRSQRLGGPTGQASDATKYCALRWSKEDDMSSPASLKNHPIHPMLVALPIGLWIFALICDVVFATGGAAIWNTVALYCVAAGIVGALLAAVPGFIDYLSIDEAAMKRIGTYHLLLNLG